MDLRHLTETTRPVIQADGCVFTGINIAKTANARYLGGAGVSTWGSLMDRDVGTPSFGALMIHMILALAPGEHRKYNI